MDQFEYFGRRPRPRPGRGFGALIGWLVCFACGFIARDVIGEDSMIRRAIENKKKQPKSTSNESEET